MKKLLLSFALILTVLELSAAPRKVTFQRKGEKGWEMLVDGKPFFVNGAVVYTSQDFNVMPANYGANAIRCFSLPADKDLKILDKAENNGLMVQVGLGFKQLRNGYYRKNDGFMEAQEKSILAQVERLKDHPAVLCWSIGNEILIFHNDKPNDDIYESIQRISKGIHAIDPNHPVCITVQEDFPKAVQDALKNICTDLDFLTVNGYTHPGGGYPIPENLDGIGYDKPYILSEFGPYGWWHHEALGKDRYSPWGCVVDFTSTEKEAFYVQCYDTVLADPRCVGTTIFLWGNQTSWRDEVKEWYGLVDKNGYTYGAVDIAQYYWTGHYPVVRAPRIENRNDLTMNGHVVSDWLVVKPGQECSAKVEALAAEGTSLRYQWRITKERVSGEDGKFPDGIQGLIYDNGNPEVHFVAPYAPGRYRLYIHVYDDVNRKAAYASFVFLVEGEAEALKDLGGRA